jgi:hypothetical protein
MINRGKRNLLGVAAAAVMQSLHSQYTASSPEPSIARIAIA